MTQTLQAWLEQLKKNAFVPLILSVFFIVMIGILGVHFYHAFDVPKATAPDTVLVAPPTPPPQVANLHLLGAFDAAQVNVPITQLQLTLQGTIVAENGSESKALILSPGEPTKIYGIGDYVPGNAKIEKIDSYTVILNNNGEYQKLSLPLKTLPNIHLPKDEDQ